MAWSYTQKAADQLYADDEHGPVVFDPGATLGAPGSGNVISSGLPIAGQLGVWVDATHITGSSTLPIAAHAAHTGDVTSPAGSVVLTYANPVPASKAGLPTGGTTGQVLAKSTNADYATGWVAGGGNVINVATPASGQLAMWTDATHIQGVAALPATNMPALAGDVTSTAGTFATTYNNPVPNAKGGLPIGGTANQVLAKNTGTNYDATWINPPSSGGNVANSGSPQGGQLALWTDSTHIQGLTLLPSTNFPSITGDIVIASGTLSSTYNNAVPVAKAGVPVGGTINQVLQKNSSTNYDVGWVTPTTGGGVSSVFTRTGAIVATAGDYTFAQIGSKPTTILGYGITDAFTQASADALYAPLAHSHTFASLTSKPTTLLGYGITDAQPLDTELTAIAGLASSTDNFIVGVANVWSARTPAQVRTTLGLVIGTNVQAWDADLDAIAAVAAQTAFGRGFLTQVDAAGARGYIGAGSGGGDLSSNTAISVDNELALFNLTSGKSIKRATSTGIIKLTAGVVGTATAGTDYQAPGAYLTANQPISLTGEITGGPAATSIATTITAKAVTYAKIQDISATSRVLGRVTAGAGVTEELTAANLKTILGLAFTDISGTATDAQVPDIHTLTGIPNLTSNGFVKTGGGIGTLSVDTASYLTANQSITLSGDVSGTGATAITTAIGANKVTLGMMATIATASILGRTTAATGNVEVLTSLPWAYTGDVTRAANSNALVYNNVLPTSKGGLPTGGTSNQVLSKIDGTNYNTQWVTPTVYEPALGNPSTNGYILSSTTGGTRSWIAPAAGGGTPGGTSGQPQYNASGAFAGVTNVVMVMPGTGTVAAAASAATAGTLLQLAPGTFVENAGVELPDNVHLRGSGQYVSKITSTLVGTSAPFHGAVAPGNNSIISDLSIIGNPNTPTATAHVNAISRRAGCTKSWTNVLVQNCYLYGSADVVFCGISLGVMTFVNCLLEGPNDIVMWQCPTDGTFINCEARHTTEAAVIGGDVLGGYGFFHGDYGGTLRLHNCRYSWVGACNNAPCCPVIGMGRVEVYDFVVDVSKLTGTRGGSDLSVSDVNSLWFSNVTRTDGLPPTCDFDAGPPTAVQTKLQYTVANLPLAPAIGQTETVTNGAAALAYNATVTGGGSTKYLVFWNGTAWKVVGGGTVSGGGGVTEVQPGASTIQAALATAVAGDTVRLAAGIFDMTSLGNNGYILLPDNVNIIGHGPEVTIIKSNRDCYASPGTGILAPGSNCLIQDLAIVGVSATGTGNENTNPLSARSAGGFTKNYDNAIYRNCYLKGVNDVIICVGASLGHTTFEDCVIEGQCDIIMWQCAKNLVLRNCDLIHTTPAAWPGIGQTMLLMGDDNGSIKLYNCKIIARGATATASFSALENVGANSFIEAYDVVIDYQGSVPSGGYHDIQNYGSGSKTMLLSNVTRADGKPLVVDPDFTIPVNSAKNTLLSVTVALLPSNPGVGDTAWVTDGASGLLYNATIAAGGTTKYFVQWNGTNWKVLGGGAVGTAGGGVSDFLALTDTPDAYTGAGSKLVAVNSGATALEFVTAPTGGGTPGGATRQVQFNNAGTAFGGTPNAYIDTADGMLTCTGSGISGFWSQLKIIPAGANLDSAIFLRATHTVNQDWFFGAGSGAGWNHFRIADLTAAIYDVLTIRTGSGHEVVLGGKLGWTATDAAATIDTAIGRSSAGSLEVTNGTGGVYRDLLARNFGVGGFLDWNTDVGLARTAIGVLKVTGGGGTGTGIIIGNGTVIAGGATDQVLAKNSATDYDLKWITPSSGGAAISGTPANLQYARWTNATTISGVAASTVKTDLALTATDVGLGSVTNNAQTQAAVVPNTAPTAGQVLIGNAGNTAYAKNTISGSGATITLGATGVVTISAIAKASITGAPTGAFVGDTDTQTLTNKRVNPRVIASATNNTTPTPDVSTADVYTALGMTVGMTFGSPTGTPVDGQELVVRVKDNGSAQSIAWNAIYRASTDLSLPLTTTAGKLMYLGFMYNSTDSKWDMLAKLDNF